MLGTHYYTAVAISLVTRNMLKCSTYHDDVGAIAADLHVAIGLCIKGIDSDATILRRAYYLRNSRARRSGKQGGRNGATWPNGGDWMLQGRLSGICYGDRLACGVCGAERALWLRHSACKFIRSLIQKSKFDQVEFWDFLNLDNLLFV